MDNDEAKTVLSGVTTGLIVMTIGGILAVIACAGLVYWCLTGILW